MLYNAQHNTHLVKGRIDNVRYMVDCDGALQSAVCMVSCVRSCGRVITRNGKRVKGRPPSAYTNVVSIYSRVPLTC